MPPNMLEVFAMQMCDGHELVSTSGMLWRTKALDKNGWTEFSSSQQ
jgi:hypothetical protein